MMYAAWDVWADREKMEVNDGMVHIHTWLAPNPEAVDELSNEPNLHL